MRIMKPSIVTRIVILCLSLCLSAAVAAETPDPAGVRPVSFFRITVVDSATSRGIPAVQLETTDARVFLTDSAGVVAFCEPEMMGTTLWFTLSSFGYVFPPNGFGQHGTTLNIKPGGSAVLSMNRVNVAQRLYRITGTDIYRDSVLLGDRVPATQDKTNSPVMGMDSVQSAVYKGKMYWFWGDTSLTRNPLGNYRSTGAVSDMPGSGGLDPDEGVSLTFWRDKGSVRPMFDEKHMPIWVGGPRVVKDSKGKEHLFINYTKVIGNMQGSAGDGIAEFDDEAGRLKIVTTFPKDLILKAGGNVLKREVDGKPYFYFTRTWADTRCPATFAAMTDMSALETFTCVKDGKAFTGKAEEIDRDKAGKLRWAWRKDTSPASGENLQKMREAKLIRDEEMPYAYRDANTSATIVHHGGTISYNPFRKRWTSVFSEIFGRASFLGEVWYAEGDTPLGPWVYSQKIVTHRMGEEGIDATTYAKKEAQIYSFYNPKQHPEFMKEDGRFIYFEGTYTTGFTANNFPTPGYNYNQIMYKLDLNDPRTFVPAPVYHVEGKQTGYRTKANLPKGWKKLSVAFFAPDRQRPGTIPVYETNDKDGVRLSVQAPEGAKVVAFYGEDASATKTLPNTMPLYERLTSGGQRAYATASSQGDTHPDKPICRVWPNPIESNPYLLDSLSSQD